MKEILSIFVLLTLLISRVTASDIKFLPPEVGASISFEGSTQAGIDMHRFEIRRLSYIVRKEGERKMIPAYPHYVVYFAGNEYGPRILKTIEGHSPLIRKVEQNLIEVYFITGAHTHIRQKWKLVDGGAEFISEEGIEWSERPKR